MRNIAFEIRKVMLYEKGLLILLLFVAISILWLFFTDEPMFSEMVTYEEEYSMYLKKVEGAYSEEKGIYLEQEAANIANSSFEQRKGFEVIFEQYLYVCEDTQNRYFLQTNGWSGLFARETFDFFLVLAVVLIAAPIFCREFEFQMDTLILTNRECRKSCLAKIFVAGSLVSIFSLLSSGIRYLYFYCKYGLPNGDYPIQSIEVFSESTKGVSLLESYLWISLFQCFGCILLTVVIMFLSVLCKKYIFVLFGAMAIMFVPYLALTKTIIFQLPIPLPFLIGNGFFEGRQTMIDSITGDEVVLFDEIGITQFLLLLIISLMLMFGMFTVIIYKSTNKWQLMHKKRCKFTAILAFSLMCLLCGCQRQGEADDESPLSSIQFQNEEEQIVGRYQITRDTISWNYCLQDVETGEMLDLDGSPMSVMYDEQERIVGVFCQEPYVYYTKIRNESYINRVGSYSSNVDIVSIVKLNVDTWEEEVIFEQNASSGRSILGIEYTVGDKWEFLLYHNKIYVDGDVVYFQFQDEIRKVNINTEEVTIFEERH